MNPTMRWAARLAAASALWLLPLSAQGATYYVWTASPANGPGTSWATAFHDLQSAVDAAVGVGDRVWVTNGVYGIGGRVTPGGTLPNVVVVTNAIIVESVNGPGMTSIEGYGFASGPDAVRCAYLANGAVLSGFTLTRGATLDSGDQYLDQSGGGAYAAGAVLTNCIISGNDAARSAGGVCYGTLHKCVVAGNWVDSGRGGGVYQATLNNCSLTDNSAGMDGGGASGGVLSNCVIAGNSTWDVGGGASGSTLRSCIVTNNMAYYGGGTYGGSATNCVINYNVADDSGGGAYAGTLNACTFNGNETGYGDGGGICYGTANNCLITYNWAGYDGGGASSATLKNCTFVGNSADNDGGGISFCTAYNCIAYYNSGYNEGDNFADSSLSYSCTTPQPGGTGNIISAPVFVDFPLRDFHLGPAALCINAGNNAYAPGAADRDGNPRIQGGTVDMGAYESAYLFLHIEASAGPGGSISPSGTVSVPISSTQSFAITPNPGYHVENVVVDGVSRGAMAYYVFENVTSNHTISATFDLTRYLITASAGVGGSIQPQGSIWVLEGTNQTFAITPNSRYVISDVIVDGTSVGATSSWTFFNVTNNHSIQALFVRPWYVWTNSPADGPGTNWDTAFHDIQSAVDAASSGDAVFVTNGVYATGGRVTPGGALTCRVVVNKTITVRSVNGPADTIILGQGPVGPAAVRCAYLSSGAVLSGFTLSNGCTDAGTLVTLVNASGGGAYGGTLINCIITGNAAGYGGGAAQSTVSRCTLGDNSAASEGGGAYGGSARDCLIHGNLAYSGGGLAEASASNCILSNNTALAWGGGFYATSLVRTLTNSVITGNSAHWGGGTYSGTVRNCTITRNSASWCGGGTDTTTVLNSIVYHNQALEGPNFRGGEYAFSCTTPDPGGTGNITTEPALATLSHLAADSPCIAAAASAYRGGVDVDGEPWSDPPCIGCDQVVAGAVTGDLSVAISAQSTNVAGGYAVSFTADIRGKAYESVWDFGDGTRATNQPGTAHAWTIAGDYPVVLTAFNQTYPAGASATTVVHVLEQPVHYAKWDSAHPVAPYVSWNAAATNIQDAVDAATVAGAKVLVADGVYATGGRATPHATLTNRIVVTKPIIIESAGGPANALIVGQGFGTNGPVRCAFLASGALLSGFTLTNGCGREVTSGDHFLDQSGGGVYGGAVSNCLIIGNVATWSGGGTFDSIVQNCTITGNVAVDGGGSCESVLNDSVIVLNHQSGADNCLLTNCTVSRNWGQWGGGTAYSALDNCAVISNSVYFGDGGGIFHGVAYNCAITDNYVEEGDGGGAYNTLLQNCTLSRNWVLATFGGSGGGICGGSALHCTISDNRVSDGGGGVTEAGVTNCIIRGNWAYADGGGAKGGWLVNSLVSGNTAGQDGGGMYGGTARNLTVVGNTAAAGGGANDSSVTNSILYYNSASAGPNFAGLATLAYCCTSPDPGGIGNITNAPAFVDYALGNFRLSTNSLCINAGNSTCAAGPTDLDGNPRIVDATVDMGAYECQLPPLLAFHLWLQGYGLPSDGSSDYTDTDLDGINNFLEWHCRTVPTNSLSVLQLLTPTLAGDNVTVRWQSVAALNYFLERSTNLLAGSGLSLLATNLPGQAGTTTYTDTNAAGLSPLYYRVGVGE